MSKEITKANIIQEIQDKFKLREFDPTPFLFSETVIPTYSIEKHVQHAFGAMKEVSITGTGGVYFLGPTQNTRWSIYRYNVIFMGSGAHTVAGVYVKRTGTPTIFVYLDLTAGQTVSYAVPLPQPLDMAPGDGLYINIDGYTTTANLRLYVDGIAEEIR